MGRDRMVVFSLSRICLFMLNLRSCVNNQKTVTETEMPVYGGIGCGISTTAGKRAGTL